MPLPSQGEIPAGIRQSTILRSESFASSISHLDHSTISQFFMQRTRLRGRNPCYHCRDDPYATQSPVYSIWQALRAGCPEAEAEAIVDEQRCPFRS